MHRLIPASWAREESVNWQSKIDKIYKNYSASLKKHTNTTVRCTLYKILHEILLYFIENTKIEKELSFQSNNIISKLHDI